MADLWDTIQDSRLFEEHLLLGGIFGDDDPLLAAPLRYAEAIGELEAFAEGCALCDLSGTTAVLVSGAGADRFVTTACAGEALPVGACSFQAVVIGDGSIAAVPLVARTGDAEYVLYDATERGAMLMPWLGFLAGIEQDGYRPFAGVRVEDITDELHPLLLWGPQAPDVLGDYLAEQSALPARGEVLNVNLDRITSLVAAPPAGGTHCYLVLVPPRAARVLWRSLLSFVVVTPVGVEALSTQVRAAVPWASHVLAPERLEVSRTRLERWGLARQDATYVGARALSQHAGR